MTKEEFSKLWKDSTREEILNQYYFDYQLLQSKTNIIKEAKEYIKNNDIMKVSKEENTKGAIFCDEGILEILDKENK